MRRIAGFLACGICMLAAAAATPQLQASALEPTANESEAMGDVQGSARLESDGDGNTASLIVRLIGNDNQTITASRVDIQLEPLEGAVIEKDGVKFVFDEAWDDSDITVKTYHYNEETQRLTLFIATNGKKGLMEAIEDSDQEATGGTLSVEADGPVNAKVAYSTVAAGGVRMEVPSVGGSSVLLTSTGGSGGGTGSAQQTKYPFSLKFQLDDDPDYNFHIDTDDDGGYEHELFKVKIEKKDGSSYSEIDGSPFTVQHGELEDVSLEDGEYRVTVTECPAGYVVSDAEHEITVSGGEAAYTFLVSRAAEEQPGQDGRVVTPIRFDILVKDNEGAAVSGVVLKLTGGGLHGETYTSDANGEIEVSDEVEGVLAGTLTYDYEVTHIPDGYDEAANGQITYSQSGATSFDITLTKSSEKHQAPAADTRDITLRVKDDEGNPVAGVQVYVEDGKTARIFVTNSDGEAAADALPYGEYTVRTGKLPEGYEGSASAALTVSKDGVSEVTLTVKKSADSGNTGSGSETKPGSEGSNPGTEEGGDKPGTEGGGSQGGKEEVKTGSITVTVRDDYGDAVPGVQFRVEGNSRSLAAMSDENGRFTMTDLQYGLYKLTVIRLPRGYAAIDPTTSFVIGDGSGTNLTFKVKAYDKVITRDVSVVVTDADGKPAAGVTVKLTGDGVDMTVVTDANGRISLKGLKLGHYKLAVSGAQSGSTEFDLTTVSSTAVKLALTKPEVKPSTSGSSGSGSSGGGSYSSSRSSSSRSTQPVLPSYVIKGGSWTQDASGRWTYTNGRQYANEWAAVYNPYANTAKGQAAYDWFRFGKDGIMLTGWFTDEAGDTYYLHPVSDGTQGHMYTGWQWIDDNNDGAAECYFFEMVSNGYKGRLYKSGVTPDGYTVNAKGQWTQNGIVMTKSVTAAH